MTTLPKGCMSVTRRLWRRLSPGILEKYIILSASFWMVLELRRMPKNVSMISSSQSGKRLTRLIPYGERCVPG